MVKILLGFLLMVACLTGSGEAQGVCGGPMRRGTLRKAGSLASPSSDSPVQCKWRLRVPRGLHIEASFEEFNVDPCCSNFTVYDSAMRGFKWQDENVISRLSGRKEPFKIIFPTGLARIKYDIASGESGFSFNFKAVIPEDGNCGYNLVAGNKAKVFRSPGFPKMKTSNLGCLYGIRSEPGFIIKVTVTKLITEEGDFLEIHHGQGDQPGISTYDRITAIEGDGVYLSAANSMNLYFNATEKLARRGFKVRYIAVPDNSTIPRPEGLACWEMTIVKSPAILDRLKGPTKTICPEDMKCGRRFMRGTSTTLSTPITNEFYGCLPQALCGITSCDGIPSSNPTMGELHLEECRSTCCDTELCNEVETETKPEKTIKCYEYTSTKSELPGLPTGGKSEKTCDVGSQCIRFIAEAQLTTPIGDMTITTTQGRCIPKVPCDSIGCNLLPSAPGMNFTSCDVKCCEEDLCNDEEGDSATTNIVSPPTESVRCYESMLMKTDAIGVMMNTSSIKNCNPGDVCLKLNAKATMDPMEVDLMQGTCVPRAGCSEMFCNILKNNPVLPATMKFSNCEVNCCETDLCNAS